MIEVAELAKEYADSLNLTSEVFWYGFETDTKNFTGLRYQVQEAGKWLNEHQDSLTLAVNFHSDSGVELSHIIGCYRQDAHGSSYRLAQVCTEKVEKILETNKVWMWDYSDYIFARVMPSSHITCLIEMGSHQSTKDMIILDSQDGRRRLGQAIVDGCLKFQNKTI